MNRPGGRALIAPYARTAAMNFETRATKVSGERGYGAARLPRKKKERKLVIFIDVAAADLGAFDFL